MPIEWYFGWENGPVIALAGILAILFLVQQLLLCQIKKCNESDVIAWCHDKTVHYLAKLFFGPPLGVFSHQQDTNTENTDKV